MNSQRQVIVRDLAEEAKKRIVFLAVCVVGLSYLMSLTSSSVWVNLPAAASLIILLRYFTLDFEMRKKAAAYNSKPSSENALSKSKPAEFTNVVEKSDWRKKVNSPAVEEAIDNFSRHLISEWVTDLWYSKLTPDKEGPEELIQIINDVLGEISRRSRNINLIDLLTRDLVNLICNHLELFRVSQTKFENQESGLLFIEQRDKELRRVLAAENKLHPALFSAEAEHKVLQHLMDGLISFAFRPEDLQCAFFRFIVRELLACAVMRPVLNLANPRFINERIENVAISKSNKRVVAAEEASQSKPNGSSKIPSDHFSRFLDPTATGVELVQLKSNQSMNGTVATYADAKTGSSVSKDPLLSIDTRTSRSWNSLPMNSQIRDDGDIQRFRSGGEWGDMLDIMSRRKSATLAPENLENMWAKGRHYRKKEDRLLEKAPQKSTVGKFVTGDNSKIPKSTGVGGGIKVDSSLAQNVQSAGIHRSSIENLPHRRDKNMSNSSQFASYPEDNEHGFMHADEDESGSTSSYTSEEEDAKSITGLDSPGTKVWDGKTNRNLAVSHIHHPLENPNHTGKKTSRRSSQYQRLSGLKSGRKRSRSSSQGVHVWQEVERTSFLSGDGQDILRTKSYAKADESTDDSDVESFDRFYSGTTASSSMSSISVPQNHSLTPSSLKNSLMVDSFFRLRCEVLGANIVKSGSRTFAVYSISVTDVNNNSWSIKRRFRHFEELHRRLKEYPEYNLHLPPKHFLSTGLDLPVIRERCILLDRYLKNLLQLPTVSGSIEVWDFLSVDSQTYIFSNSFSIIETLSVDLEAKPSQEIKKYPTLLTTPKEQGMEQKESALQAKHDLVSHGFGMVSPKGDTHSPGKRFAKPLEDSQREKASTHTSESRNDSATDPTLPIEWVLPNLTVPILDLVDVIFQLQDGGWIRRKAFWAVKQILQLGMGDALDDWLLEKILLLRKGSVVASAIKRVEQILWPDGIFITKHPKRRQPPAVNSPQSSPHAQQPAGVSSPKQGSPLQWQASEISSPRLSEEQQQEAYRRAKFVYELMIDKAPATVVSLVGRKEYEQCIKDVYFFLQSSVCLKLLAFDILELLLLSAFPEMDCVVRQVHDEKHRFGEFRPN